MRAESRLTSPEAGGIPLAAAFHAVLDRVWTQGPCPLSVTTGALRDKLAFKEARVSQIWGSWEELAGDLLSALAEWGLVQRNDNDCWTTTALVKPGKELAVLDRQHRVKIVLRDAQAQQARDTIARARQMVDEVIAYLDTAQGDHGVLRYSRARLASVSAGLGSALNRPALRARNDGPSYIQWYREWVRTADWHSINDARLAWERQFPDRPLFITTNGEKGAAIRSAARLLVQEGKVEVRPGNRSDGRGGAHQYHWIQAP
jgi:hypothetical protein